MKHCFSHSRRHFFSKVGAGLLAWTGMPNCLHAMEAMSHMPKMAPNKASPNFKPDVEIDPVGTELALRSLPFSGVLPQMLVHSMGMHGSGLPVGIGYPMLRVKVKRKISRPQQLPQKLSSIKRYTLGDTANPKQPVPIAISEGPMPMVLNGRPYAYDDVLPSKRIPVNTVQLMEIFPDHGGGHKGEMGMMRDNSVK